ncbi:ubiquitin-like domain-containing protein CIP73 isoform X1 [Lactuca sativa]|uniref:ubiquitin-like domain-containing protein CIP73 isoform X1 n=1 Tax=Lactuca sativa TaxID=4236 RepID=UPI000CB1D2FC|nr:ubiquitin-like domain-containing protein CIP73 isoform X1 [Lactuca sativa]
MASNHGGKDVMDSGSSEGNTSEATVEIKIKTLDSQTYTLRVDKRVPVPALKEQIASVTGVLSEQQRLICRGKVLKDDQLLSAYHVEDGHTLHLVARQPINPSLASFSDHTASDPASNSRHSMGNQHQHGHGPSVVVGTFNISDQGDGGIPDFSRIVSAVLGSFGIANAGSGGEAVDLQQHISERLSRIPGLNEIRSSNGQQPPEDGSGRGAATFTLPSDVSMESLQLPVIPDSLSTLSQYLRRLRQEFSDNVRLQGNNNRGESNGTRTPPHVGVGVGVGQGGLPTPAALGEVTQSARQLLIEEAGECLMQLTRQLGDQNNVSDPVTRLRMQSNALRSGALLQNLGAFLLELGRTTMTLRLGHSPSDAVVNAGPAVFISTSGPNPIMVQPLPFQPGTSFGTTTHPPPPPPVVVTGSASGTSSFGSALRPRNIDIRIRTGSVMRETNGGGADGGVTNQENGLRQSRGSEVRVVPIRISVPPSESSRSSMGVLLPVLARAQNVVDSGNGNNGYGGENIDSTTTTTEVPSGLDQLLRNLFPGEHHNHGVGNSFIFQGQGQGEGGANVVESVQTAQEEAASASTVATDEGTFLSNLLHQIMPIVSQHLNNAMEDTAAQPSSTVEENQDRGGASSRQSDDPPSSKRQKTE